MHRKHEYLLLQKVKKALHFAIVMINLYFITTYKQHPSFYGIAICKH